MKTGRGWHAPTTLNQGMPRNAGNQGSWNRGLGQTLPAHTLTLNFRPPDCEGMNTVVSHHLVLVLSYGRPGKLHRHKAKNYGGEEVLSLSIDLFATLPTLPFWGQNL